MDTPSANAAIEGTDFALSVDELNVTTLTLIDGRVNLINPETVQPKWKEFAVLSGEQATVAPGQAPTKTSVIDTVNLIQWCLYYPGVLDPDELALDSRSGQLAASFAAYRSGDLPKAIGLCPKEPGTTNTNERLYQAALLLAASRVDDCESLLQTEDPGNPLATALRYVIAAVKDRAADDPSSNSSPSQLLGVSYYEQSRRLPDSLDRALTAARAAVSISTNFAFAWERVAELEFSRRRVPAAEAALDRALKLAPANAQAHALKGFLLAAQNHIGAAIREFDAAIQLDGRLANAWLGRGLCRIKRGEARAGREDLMTAAVLEPNRALLHSYLGKALGDAGHGRQAQQELALARQWDAKDPTPWLYSAVLKQQQNRVNEAISDLEASEERNDNRSLFRSRLLLDEDFAVRSANLASIYRDAGMTEVSVREAARAVTYDYANSSAHLFLADSYNDLRDPTRFNLRYETVWFNELLLANILSPVGGGRLSQHLSQQEYLESLPGRRPGLRQLDSFPFRQQVRHPARFAVRHLRLDQLRPRPRLPAQ